MVIWAAFGVITLASAIWILRPLLKSQPGGATNSSEIQVYVQQLSEIDREKERGLISPADHTSARAEIGRRLIAAKAQADQMQHSSSDRRVRFVALALIAWVPAAGIAGYSLFGTPEVPDQPLSARGSLVQVSAPPDTEALIAQVEEHLVANPDDARGWSVLGPVYMRLGRYDDAASAWENVLRINGSEYETEVQYAEALVATRNGEVPIQAEEAFKRALDLEPQSVSARFYLALALGQRGETLAAAHAWLNLLEDAGPSAPRGSAWVIAAVRQLRALNGQLGSRALPVPEFAVSLETPQGAPAVDAAQAEAIAGMVAGLAARLNDGGGSSDEWLRLIRSYQVLGDDARAQSALRDGVADLRPKDQAAAENLIVSANTLGVFLPDDPSSTETQINPSGSRPADDGRDNTQVQ